MWSLDVGERLCSSSNTEPWTRTLFLTCRPSVFSHPVATICSWRYVLWWATQILWWCCLCFENYVSGGQGAPSVLQTPTTLALEQWILSGGWDFPTRERHFWHVRASWGTPLCYRCSPAVSSSHLFRASNLSSHLSGKVLSFTLNVLGL